MTFTCDISKTARLFLFLFTEGLVSVDVLKEPHVVHDLTFFKMCWDEVKTELVIIKGHF